MKSIKTRRLVEACSLIKVSSAEWLRGSRSDEKPNTMTIVRASVVAKRLVCLAK